MIVIDIHEKKKRKGPKYKGRKHLGGVVILGNFGDIRRRRGKKGGGNLWLGYTTREIS